MSLPYSLGHVDGITLRRTEGCREVTRHTTTFEEDPLGEGAPVVVIPDLDKAGVHVAIGDVDAVVAILQSDTTERHELASVIIRRRSLSPSERSCTICHESFDDGDSPYYLKQIGKDPESGDPLRADTYIHADDACLSHLINCLDDVWSYTEDLLPEAI